MKNIFILLAFIISFNGLGQQLPEGFVYLSDIDVTIKSELKYFGTYNFIGKQIDGYQADKVIVTKKTALALHKIQKKLYKNGLSLKIFDAYRPQQAVDHFVRWAKVLNDTTMKSEFYPKVPKSELFKQGFIAAKSGHTRGSTVDLTIVNLETNVALDMGSPYDFFGEISHPFSTKISTEQQKNRMLLRKIMLKYNFKPYENEWWHFTLINEPFPNTYFNFPVY